MELKFDEIPVDTTLAKDFINKKIELLQLYNDYEEVVKYFFRYVFNGIQFLRNTTANAPALAPHYLSYREISRKLHDLASLLKQNTNLIAQLEYYTRGIPVSDTNAELNLLIQSIQCISLTERISYNGKETLRLLSFDKPLLSFRDVVNELQLVRRSMTLINLSMETAFISYLFVKLCHEVGLNYIHLEFQHYTPLLLYSPAQKPSHGIKGYNSGTLAVVSEGCDIDSAIDTFLSVSKKAPWRLRKILVQESIYQHFKDALRWKHRMKKCETGIKQSCILCSETLTYDGRTFLIDPVQPAEEQPAVVTVEAYRTTKEMIILVQQDQTRYLSLWANGIAEINEITHGTRAPVLWVNTLADFRGPPQVSEAVFAYSHDNEILIKKCDKVAKLCALAQEWLKMDFERRREILIDVLDKYATSDRANKLYTKVKLSLEDCTVNSFVDVGKDYVCMGISQPSGILGFETSDLFFNVANFKSLLQGNAFVLYTSPIKYCEQPKLNILQEAGVPVVDVGELSDGDFSITPSRLYPNTQTRVIWTNSGTIFAN